MNKSDLGGVLQRDNIHIVVAPPGSVTQTMDALRASPATSRWKAKFIVATDGQTFEAEELGSAEAPIVCRYREFPDNFGFFLPLAGISTVKQIRESAFDIKATGRLNRLYVELLKDNADWDTDARREDMNHFMARLIFCFFAEDTGIFPGNGVFTQTVAQMSANASNTHEVISTIFKAMNTKSADRAAANLPRWVEPFPYVNGGLFSGSTEVPRFSKIARSYLLNVGALEWKKINPDIFGSMIQAVADDEERGALGMHYTSVPNILKVLNPLFLDDLREKLEEAGENLRKLLNLRNRMARIRVFDPACGSGNFLVIAYKEMRAIEAEINRRRGEAERATEIPLTNFRGIELRSFPAEIARLALIIAEYQCDVQYRGPQMALAEFLPLDAENWITCGNALRLDWLSICPPTGTGVKFHADDLFAQPLEQAQIDFENEGGETYIAGNPPYAGSQWRSTEQQSDMDAVFASHTKSYKDLDYVACWLIKAAEYGICTKMAAAFVATKSINQGRQVAMLWPVIQRLGYSIFFAHRPFDWKNLASKNAGVTVVIVGFSKESGRQKTLYEGDTRKTVSNINAYLLDAVNVIVEQQSRPLNGLPQMDYGNKPSDGGHLILTESDKRSLVSQHPEASIYLKKLVGSREFTSSTSRWCLWIDDELAAEALRIPLIRERVEKVRQARAESVGSQARGMANRPHRFVYAPHRDGIALVVPSITTDNRDYLPVGIVRQDTVVSNKAAVIYDAPLWTLSIVASRMHEQWVGNVCVRMRMGYSYSNTLGWNTFPIPLLTEKNKGDLTRCAEDILLARESHFPSTITDLYDPETMPADLRAAHERNDEVLERIYIGRRFKNDTERLEKLFEMYTKMTAAQGAKTKATKARARA